MMININVWVVLVAAIGGCIAVPACAQAKDWACRDVMVAPAKSVNGIVLSDWRSTVCLEHADRMARLLRITSSLPPSQQPQFYQYIIPVDKLPPGFRVDIPVLRVVFPENSFFETDRTVLRPQAVPMIEAISASLRREIPDVAVFVAGHTDDRGSDQYNQNLSVRRAALVSAAMRGFNVGQVALWRIGFGEDLPVAANTTEDGLAQNRRVEFLFAAKTEAVAVWLNEQSDEGECRIIANNLTAVCAEKPVKPVPVRASRARTYPAQLDRDTPVIVSRPSGNVVEQAPVRDLVITVTPRRYTAPLPSIR